LEHHRGGPDLHRELLELTLGAEEELRILKDAPLHVRRAVSPGPVQVRDLAALQVVLRDGLGQQKAVVSSRPRHGHQVLHRRLGRDTTRTDVRLYSKRKVVDEGKPLRNPAHASLKKLRHLLIAEGTISKHLEQPPLLDRRLLVRRAQRSVQDQSVHLAQVPHRRLDRVQAQPLQEPDATMTVDHLVAARILKARHHHDRYLLPVLGKRGEEPALPLRPPQSQRLVRHLELVKFQIHPKARAAVALQSSRAAPRGSLSLRPAD
jgi:hypothetical protein